MGGITSNFFVAAFFSKYWSEKSSSADQSSDVMPCEPARKFSPKFGSTPRNSYTGFAPKYDCTAAYARPYWSDRELHMMNSRGAVSAGSQCWSLGSLGVWFRKS